MSLKSRRKPINGGPLRNHPTNPYFFADGKGCAVYLAGSHSWNNLRDRNPGDPPRPFDYNLFLDFQEKFNHNFFRLWAWELPRTVQVEGVTWYTNIFPWPRTGPGLAADGKPKFDLSQFVPSFFDRMRERVAAAGKRGIYVCVMLFDGFGPQFLRKPDDGFPYDGANNINGIACDGRESQSLADPAVTAVQEAYVRKVIDTINGLDNVIYEIANEAGAYSTEWQYHFIRFAKEYEKGKPKQHTVGMTFQYDGATNQELFDSEADWVSPNGADGYGNNWWAVADNVVDPPPARAGKIIINDTDHSYSRDKLVEAGGPGQHEWVWKNLTRGHSVAFMDPYLTIWTGRNAPKGNQIDPRWNNLRKAMGYALSYAQRMNLSQAFPQRELSSSKYCLAHAGHEYLVFLPDGKGWVDLSALRGKARLEWFNSKTGKVAKRGTVKGGGRIDLSAPFKGQAVLLIQKSGDS